MLGSCGLRAAILTRLPSRAYAATLSFRATLFVNEPQGVGIDRLSDQIHVIDSIFASQDLDQILFLLMQKGIELLILLVFVEDDGHVG